MAQVAARVLQPAGWVVALLVAPQVWLVERAAARVARQARLPAHSLVLEVQGEPQRAILVVARADPQVRVRAA